MAGLWSRTLGKALKWGGRTAQRNRETLTAAAEVAAVVKPEAAPVIGAVVVMAGANAPAGMAEKGGDMQQIPWKAGVKRLVWVAVWAALAALCTQGAVIIGMCPAAWQPAAALVVTPMLAGLSKWVSAAQSGQ